MQRKQFEDPVVLFASTPDLKELCSITVRVESGTTIAGNVTTQPKILKCRELIFTEPDIIATPSYEQYDCFTVVMTQTLFTTGRIQARLKKNGLQPSKPVRVNPKLYQACLHYTLLARLAPAWNKTADWLIQGRDFLCHTGCANAIKCELMVNTDQLYMSVSASVLRLAPLQLVDLNLSELEIQSLLYNAEHGNEELSLHNSWCRVIPSMKKGRLCSISLSIPEDSPFSSYRDLKRHWKNTYGFRLPETDDDIFYGQISFCGTGGKQFTYPSICLRPEPLQCVPRVDPKPILSAFLQDLHCKLPSVCGHTLRFQPQVRYPVSAVYVASQDIKGPGANLGKRSSSCNGQMPLRNPRDLIHMKAVSQPVSHSTQINVLKASNLRPPGDVGWTPGASQFMSQRCDMAFMSRSQTSQPLSQKQNMSGAQALQPMSQSVSQTPSDVASRIRSEISQPELQQMQSMASLSISQASQPTSLSMSQTQYKLASETRLQTPQSGTQNAASASRSQTLQPSPSVASGTGSRGGITWSQIGRCPASSGLQTHQHLPQLLTGRSSSFVDSRSENTVTTLSMEWTPEMFIAATSCSFNTTKPMAAVTGSSTPCTPGSKGHRTSLSLQKTRCESAAHKPVTGDTHPSHKQPPVFREDSTQGQENNEHEQAPEFANFSQQELKGTAGKIPSDPATNYIALTCYGDFEANSNRAGPSAPRKIVPLFRPKSLSGSHTKKETTSDTRKAEAGLGQKVEGATRIVPTFKPKSKSAAPKLPGRSDQKTSKRSKDTSAVSCPQVTSSTEDSSSSIQPSTTSFQALKYPIFSARKPQNSKYLKSPSVQSPSLKYPSCKNTDAKTPVSGKLKKKMLESTNPKKTSLARAGEVRYVKQNSQPNVHQSVMTQPLGSAFSQALHNSSGDGVTLTPTTSGSQGKRKMDSTGVDGGGGEKKARSKPHVQDVDVEMLARSNQLQKANAVTLISWLKVRGVHCKAKDKKADLVDRVKVFLAITTLEP